MSFEFTNTGLDTQTYQELYDELVAAYQAIYGPDINTDPDSPDGQRLGIQAKALSDLQQYALGLYNQIDPDFARGEVLNRIIKLAGISRQPAARSSVDVTVTTDRALTLPTDWKVEDDLGQIWTTDTAAPVLVLGANTVTLVSQDFAAVEADPATVTTPVDIVIGVLSVTNPAAATVGRDEETDPELRVRRNRSISSPATSTIGGLFSAIGDLPGVTDLAIYENDTDTLDATLSLAAHSIWCVVENGTVADIIEAIAKNKTGGTGIKGSVTGTYEETLVKPDGTEYVIAHEMAFDRPTDVPLYVNLTVEGLDGATVDVDAIKAALAALDFSIAQSATASALYAAVYSVGSDFAATLLEISDDDATFVTDYLTPAADETYTIAVADVDITDITP